MNAQNLERFKELSPPVGRLFIAAIVRFPGPAFAEPCRMSIVQSVVASCLMLLLLWMVQAQLTVRINVLQGKSFFFNWGCSYLWRNSVRDSEQFLSLTDLVKCEESKPSSWGNVNKYFAWKFLFSKQKSSLWLQLLILLFLFIVCLSWQASIYLWPPTDLQQKQFCSLPT